MTRSRPDPAAGLDPAVSRWLDGASTPAEARDVEARLGVDPALRATVERLREGAALLRSDAARPASDGLADRVILAALRGVDPEAEAFRRVARRWSAAAAALLAVGVGGTLALPSDEPTPPEREPSALTQAVEQSRLAREAALDVDGRPLRASDR